MSSSKFSAIPSGVLYAIGGAVAFSTKSIIVKLAYIYHVDAITLLSLRMLLAFPFFLLIYLWAQHRGQGRLAKLAKKDWAAAALLGFFGYYLASYLDFLGLQYINASLERIILYLNPTLLALLSWLIYRKALSRKQLQAMACCYVGVLIVFGKELQFSGVSTGWGALLVFISALSYAVYLMYSGQWVARLGALRLVALSCCFASFYCVLQFTVLRSWSDLAFLAPQVWWLSFLNATIATVLPTVFTMLAIERIGSQSTAQLGMIGPISTIFMGVFLLNEPFHIWLVIGTALVLLGVYIVGNANKTKPSIPRDPE